MSTAASTKRLSPSAWCTSRTRKGLVAERRALARAWPIADAGVLDGVMRVDLEIAGRLDHEVGKFVATERVEHVVEERDAGCDRGHATAVEIDGDGDVSLARRAFRWLCASLLLSPLMCLAPDGLRVPLARRWRPAFMAAMNLAVLFLGPYGDAQGVSSPWRARSRGIENRVVVQKRNSASSAAGARHGTHEVRLASGTPRCPQARRVHFIRTG